MTLPDLLPNAVELAPRQRRLVRSLAVLMLAALAVHLLYTSTGVGGSVADTVVNRWGQNVVYAAGVALCVVRARVARDARGPWVALAVAIGLTYEPPFQLIRKKAPRSAPTCARLRMTGNPRETSAKRAQPNDGTALRCGVIAV